MTQNLDDELFKASKARYRLLMQASESSNACRKILVPRKSSSLLLGTQTVDYAITGGNDMRLRYWSMADPAQNSYYINTPGNDECSYFSGHIGGGPLYVREQVSRVKNFPRVNANMLQAQVNPHKPGGKLVIPNTEIELAGDSIYYSVIANLITQNSSDEDGLSDMLQARNYLSQSSLGDISQGAAKQFQLEMGRDKVIVYNYNGLSEWQHFNGINMNEGNATQVNSSLNDKYASSSSSSKQGGSKSSKKDHLGDPYHTQPYRGSAGGSSADARGENGGDGGRDYLYRESRNVSHSDAILDMALIELAGAGVNSPSDQSASLPGGSGGLGGIGDSGGNSALPVLITCGRDGTVKLWR